MWMPLSRRCCGGWTDHALSPHIRCGSWRGGRRCELDQQHSDHAYKRHACMHALHASAVVFAAAHCNCDVFVHATCQAQAQVERNLQYAPSAAGCTHVGSQLPTAVVPCMQALLPLLQPDQPGGVRVLSLHGMGGIGKTTLARDLFNRLSNAAASTSAAASSSRLGRIHAPARQAAAADAAAGMPARCQWLAAQISCSSSSSGCIRQCRSAAAGARRHLDGTTARRAAVPRCPVRGQPRDSHWARQKQPAP